MGYFDDAIERYLEWENTRIQMAVANGTLEATEIDGQTWYTHPAANCSGDSCAIHRPSTHIMSEWTRILCESGLIERLCPKHGVGHPDPDSLAWFDSRGIRGYDVHGCCGCCHGTEY